MAKEGLPLSSVSFASMAMLMRACEAAGDGLVSAVGQAPASPFPPPPPHPPNQTRVQPRLEPEPPGSFLPRRFRGLFGPSTVSVSARPGQFPPPPEALRRDTIRPRAPFSPPTQPSSPGRSSQKNFRSKVPRRGFSSRPTKKS